MDRKIFDVLRRGAGFLLGYGVAVVVAALATIICMNGGMIGGSDFLGMLMVGMIYTASFGAPGFVLAMFLAWQQKTAGWLFFTVAGALNGILAVLLTVPMGQGLIGVLPFAIPGGAAGGLAFWPVARVLGLFARPEAQVGA